MHDNVNTLDEELMGSSGMMTNSDHSIEYPSRMPMSPMTNTDEVRTFYE